jgi:hypothetical protein
MRHVVARNKVVVNHYVAALALGLDESAQGRNGRDVVTR